MTALRRTPLYERHRDAGAKLVPFAGWEMPVVYGSILDEHRSVRASMGLFDVSHMGEVRIRGEDALALGQALFSNEVASLEIGRVRYGMLCDGSGGVIDDATLYRVGERELLFCVNASNTAEDLAWMQRVCAERGFAAELVDESDATGLLALQGPRACELARSLCEAPLPRAWRFAAAELAGLSVVLSRTGYTGEDGLEIYVASQDVVALWDRLRAAGGDALVPVGLGARDTLRTEAGLSLHGHELDREHTPIEAGLARFVALDQPFIGADVLRRQHAEGTARRLVGLLVDGRQVARTGYPIRTPQGEGVVTSGTFAPSIERSVAIGYVPAGSAKPGSRVHVVVRNRELNAEVTDLPFYRRKKSG